MSTASDAHHQDFGAIEAAVKETARGRAFLANFARRVQQSDMLTTLATLGRLERLSDELASRLAELEAGKVSPASRQISSGANLSQQWSALPFAPDAGRMAETDYRHALSNRALDAGHHAPPNGRNGELMQRIDALALVLSDLHRHAVELASGGNDADGLSGLASSMEIDARAFSPPEPALSSSPAMGDPNLADDEVLNKIAQALGPMP